MHQKNLRSKLQRCKEAGESDLVIRRGQIVTASRVATDMDHSPSLLPQSSSSAPVASGNDHGVGNTYSYSPFVKELLFTEINVCE